MPVDPHIFVTQSSDLSEESLKQLSTDLLLFVGRDCFRDWGEPIEKIPPENYGLLPDNLPKATIVLSVYLTSAYYAKGYERGSWPEIVSTLELLIRRLPESEVWYGGDSSDQLNKVTSEFLDQMWDYWSTHGIRPYYSGKGLIPELD